MKSSTAFVLYAVEVENGRHCSARRLNVLAYLESILARLFFSAFCFLLSLIGEIIRTFPSVVTSTGVVSGSILRSSSTALSMTRAWLFPCLIRCFFIRHRIPTVNTLYIQSTNPAMSALTVWPGCNRDGSNSPDRDRRGHRASKYHLGSKRPLRRSIRTRQRSKSCTKQVIAKARKHR